METSLKDMIRLVTPPIFINLAKRLKNRNAYTEWAHIPEGWVYAKTHPQIKGWNVPDVLKVYKEKWPRFVEMVHGRGPLGMMHESALTTNEDINSHNATMSFAYVLALVSRHKDQITILDWGGGIGHYCLLAQVLLPDVKIDYHCKDVPVLCDHGAQLFPQQHFYSDERCFERIYDFVMASTSMHYTEDWQTLLQKLSSATSGFLYIANLPIVERASSFVFVQRPYQYGYNTEYLAWCLNRTELLESAERMELDLIREFVYGYQPIIHGAPEQNVYRGYLFQRKNRELHES